MAKRKRKPGYHLTTTAVAEFFQVSQPTVVKWCRESRLPYFLIPGGTYRRIALKDLEAFVKQNTPDLLEKFYTTFPEISDGHECSTRNAGPTTPGQTQTNGNHLEE